MIKEIQYAGHSAVFLIGEKVIAIDPWLEGNPACPEDLKNLEKIDLIVLTHGHSDHASDAVRLAKQYKAKVAATFELASLVSSEGVPAEDCFFMNTGGSIDFEGYKISLTQAFHSSSYDTKDGAVYAGQPCGVVVKDEKQAIYHAGDTALFSDMKLIADTHKPDIALLPIGDVFTMGPSEAALAAEWLRCKTVIPIHYKTFPLLVQSSDEFASECSKNSIECVALEPGSTYSL